MPEKLPLSLYIHYPWCIRKCPYCDFNSWKAGADDPEPAYVDALIEDLRTEQALLGGRRSLVSVFFGGGTPSLMSVAALSRILDAIRSLFDMDRNTEVTLEANPGASDREKFRGYLEAGINRLSIGVQSFNDDSLIRLGRIHSSRDAISAFTSARDAGCTNINLDLMHGLPGQTAQEALADIDMALSLGSEHLSWYQLTLEPNTRFYKDPPVLPDEPVLLETGTRGTQRLIEGGFRRYEISAWSRPGCESVHNTNYWEFGDYLGIGAGAHGKISGTEGVFRTTRTRSPAHYVENPNRRISVVDEETLPLEFLMNALRLTDGFEAGLFEKRTGLDFDRIAGFVEEGIRQELLQWTGENGSIVAATNRGLRYLDELLIQV